MLEFMQLPELKIRVERTEGDGSTYTMKSSANAHSFFRTIFNADTILWTEESAMIILNRANEVIGYSKISSGGTASTVVDAKVIFTKALLSGAHSIILAHNHPSGNLQASEDDIKVTKQLVNAGRVLDIRVLDHLILTDKGYTSMADEGLM
jgi:DNA repair protein RadC